MNVPIRPSGNPDNYDESTIRAEYLKCTDEDFGMLYFIYNYCYIKDNTTRQWIHFKLFDAQVNALLDIAYGKNNIIVLKARQLGISWLIICCILYDALFKPEILALFFSKREEEAIELLQERLKGVYSHLPVWLKVNSLETNSKKEFALSNGSRFKASSAGGSDSYAATHVLIDEADIIYESGKKLVDLLTDVAPTVSTAGGKLYLISRSDKSRPNSTFKKIYRGAKTGETNYTPIFLPWYARPDRTQEWYELEKKTALLNYGNLDSIYEQYPATEEQALSPPSTDKRFNYAHLEMCYIPFIPDSEETKLAEENLRNTVPNAVLYRLPKAGNSYVICIDTAEGNIHSDPSVATVFCIETDEEAAMLKGQFEPAILALYTKEMAKFYNNAAIFVERNNTGHAVISWFELNDTFNLIEGIDTTRNKKKYGWRTTVSTKPLMWSHTANTFRDKEIIIHTQETLLQLADIRTHGSAGEGNHDDLALTVGLYCVYKKLFVRKFVFDFLT